MGEKVDARDCNMGAWFEAQVVKVTARKPLQSSEEDSSSSSEADHELFYHVLFDE